jgi:2-polyprenyl-3-methyl-5-hydroxy-6-metoxy-1,4-benzoquinol methylase
MGDEKNASTLDPEELVAFQLRVWGYKQGEVVSLMIHLGDRLGLYRALDGAGPVTAEELAERTGLRERWLLEWLRNQAAARLLNYCDGDRFELTPVGTAVLADETGSLAFATGAFGAPSGPELVDRLADAFRTGIGPSYDEHGPSTAHNAERMLGPWARLALVPRILPALDGVLEKLGAGAAVADVGCGAGVALIAMAEAYPNSRFHGFDPSHYAIERARVKLKEAGLSNVELHLAGGEELPREPSFDLVISFDCMHDMTRPAEVIGAVRRAIKPDGTWLIKDVRSAASFRENLANPLLAMLYGFSVVACMASALSEPDGAGLGTLGFNPEVARKMTAAGGFTHFRIRDFEDPANLYYELRP